MSLESSRVPLRFVKLSPRAHSPSRGSAQAAGLDLAAAVDVVIPPGGRCAIAMVIAVAISEFHYGRIAPRSGLALRSGIDVIDSDYRGNVHVILFNHGSSEFQVSAGSRVAQLVLEKISYANPERGVSLESSARGASGFGSTGV